jgi:nitroreductase
MNDIIQSLLSRRSIRRFDAGRPVPREIQQSLLECACAAPSAKNEQPWHFIIVENREILSSLAEVLVYGKMLNEAPLAIAVCGETERDGKPMPQWEEDCAASMENLLLAANALGLGAVWLGVRFGYDGRESSVKKILEVPDKVSVMGIAAVGWPKESKDPHSGITANVLHANKW